METKVCKKCGRELPMTEFRIHKSGFVLNQCKDCERISAKARSKKTGMFTVTTKSGKTYKVSGKPISGGRKVVSTATDKVLYVPANITRDEARSIFATYAKVPYTGISATVVE